MEETGKNQEEERCKKKDETEKSEKIKIDKQIMVEQATQVLKYCTGNNIVN